MVGRRIPAILFLVGTAIAAPPGPVRRDITAFNLFYSSAAGLVYVITSPTSTYLPNSIIALDPVTGADTDSIQLGTPTSDGVRVSLIAPSDDGVHVYIYFPSTNSIRRMNLATHQKEFEFATTLGTNSDSIYVSWMAVAPGDPDRVVVGYWSRRIGHHVGVAAYVQGAQLPDTSPGITGCNRFVFATGTGSPHDSSQAEESIIRRPRGGPVYTLWCHNTDDTGFQLWKLRLDSGGVHAQGGWGGLAYGFNQTPAFFQGRLYFNSLGLVTDPSARTIVGEFPWVGTPTGEFTVDGEANRIYFSRAGPSDILCTEIWALDTASFTPTGHYLDCSPSKIGSGPIVRAGAGGLAMIGDFPSVFEGGPVGFFPLSAIPAQLPVSPGPVTTSDGGIRSLALPNVGLSLDSVSGRLLASVPDWVPGIGNTIVPIDAATLAPGTPVWMGSRPITTAISEDGRYLYEGFAASSMVQRLDLQSMIPDFAFPLYSILNHFYAYANQPIFAGGLLAFPGSGDTVAVALAGAPDSVVPALDAVVVYDHGVARPDSPLVGVNDMQWNSTGAVIYGADVTDPGLNMARLQPTATGTSLLDTLRYITGATLSTNMRELRCQSDICFDAAGDVIDGRSLKYLGHCPLRGRVLPDVPRSRAWYLAALPPMGGSGSPGLSVDSCDLTTFQPAESISVATQPNPSPVELLFADPDTFAISTGNEVITARRSGAVPAAKTPRP